MNPKVAALKGESALLELRPAKVLLFSTFETFKRQFQKIGPAYP
jgi:hypothetical protein